MRYLYPTLLLRGTSLVLRPPTPDDVPALYALGRDREVVRWFSWGPYRSPSEPAGWIDAQAGLRERGERLELLVVHDVHGLVGATGLSEWSRRDRRAVVGSWLSPAVWGTGVNAEAKALVLHLAFVLCELERVGAYADPGNGRSLRALEKVGFTREGVLRAFHRHGEVRKDVVSLSLLREEWAGPGLPIELVGEVPPAFVLAP